MFLLATAIFLVLATLFVVVPLYQFQERHVIGEKERDAENLQIFKERLAELEHERDAAVLEPEQFDMLKAELEKTLLTDMSGDLPVNDVVRRDSSTCVSWMAPARLVPVAAMVLIMPLSYFLYDLWGFEEDLQVANIFERSRDSQGDPEQIRDLIFELGAVLERDPANGWAAYFLARHLVSFGEMQEAARFFDRAATHIEHPQDRAVVLGQLAQTQYIASGQQMTDQVQATISQAQRLNPAEPAVLQLLGADAFVNGDYQSAITYWQRLLSMGPDAEEAEFLRAFISQAQQFLSASSQPDPQTPGPRIEVSLSLSPDADLPAGTRVFVSVQGIGQAGPPLAAKLLSVADLPSIVSLTDADAVGPFNLSSATEAVVVATISMAGSADVQSGDLQARSAQFSVQGQQEPVRLQLQIRDVIL